MINYRHCRICGSALLFTSAVPYRGVKMRRRSFTPRFASKTIRSLAHFHAAGDEGKALVCKGCFRARGPRRKYFRWGKSRGPRRKNFRWGKSHLNESVRTTGSRNVTSHDMMLSRSEWSRFDVHLFRVYLTTTLTCSKTGSRAAHPNLHSGRFRPLLQVAARFATSQAR